MEQHLTIKTRQRTTSEVIGLGFVVGKNDFFPLWITALVAMMPLIAIALLISFFAQSLQWGIFFLWWNMPLVERPVLLVLSRLILGQRWKIGDLLSDLRGGFFSQGWGMDVTFCRLMSASRIGRAAVVLLEKPNPELRKKRLTFVRQHSSGAGLIGLSCLQMAIMINLLIFILTFVPNELGGQRLFVLLKMPWFQGVSFLLLALSFSIVTVFFVAIEFMAYLNQRIIHEGWAIALDLRALAQRLCACLVFIFVFIIAPSAALPVYAAPPNANEDKNILLNITHDKKVTPLQKEKRFLERGNGAGSGSHSGNDGDDFDYGAGGAGDGALASSDSSQNDAFSPDDKEILTSATHDEKVTPLEARKHYPSSNKTSPVSASVASGELIRAIIIALLIGGGAILLWLTLKHAPTMKKRAKRHADHLLPDAQTRIFTTTNETIATPAASARKLLNDGENIAALSLIYRATLEQLAGQFSLPCARGECDQDYLQRAQTIARLPRAVQTFLGNLIGAWQHAAYANQPPPAADIHLLIDEYSQLWT